MQSDCTCTILGPIMSTHGNTPQKTPDYRSVHPLAGPIVIELKDIVVASPQGAGTYDPYAAVRSQMTAAREQLKPFGSISCRIPLS